MVYRALLCWLVLFLHAGCAVDRPQGKTEAEVLYKEAKQLSEDGRYLLATEKLNTLKSQHPYSFYATHAELLLADILFDQENFTEAAAAYSLFRDLHPKHERLPYVIFRQAEAYYRQLPSTFDRDLSSGRQAVQFYRELLSTFPNHPKADLADKRIQKIEDQFRKKAKYIADFYFKTEVFDAARWRYLDILTRFDEPELRRHSQKRVLLSSLKLQDYDACLQYSATYLESRPDPVLANIRQRCENLLQTTP